MLRNIQMSWSDSKKGSFYTVQHPVRLTAQSALHFFAPSPADLFIPKPTRLLREAF